MASVRVGGWLLGSALGLGGCGVGAFACVGDEACAQAGIAGACQPDGWCSFPDEACASGQRYGEYAGGGKGGKCVGDDSGTDTNATSLTSSATSAATTMDATAATQPAADTGSDVDVTTAAAEDASMSSPATTEDDDPSGSAGGVCGDGVMDPGEDCDDGNRSDLDACTSRCTLAACGDGFVQPGEACDTADTGALSCATFGLVDGVLGCSATCDAIDWAGCEVCEGDDCPLYAVCMLGLLCDNANCVSIGDGPGTCFGECEPGGCPDDSYCTTSFDACALFCDSDVDCPAGMSCTQLPNSELACMW